MPETKDGKIARVEPMLGSYGVLHIYEIPIGALSYHDAVGEADKINAAHAEYMEAARIKWEKAMAEAMAEFAREVKHE